MGHTQRKDITAGQNLLGGRALVEVKKIREGNVFDHDSTSVYTVIKPSKKFKVIKYAIHILTIFLE